MNATSNIEKANVEIKDHLEKLEPLMINVGHLKTGKIKADKVNNGNISVSIGPRKKIASLQRSLEEYVEDSFRGMEAEIFRFPCVW